MKSKNNKELSPKEKLMEFAANAIAIIMLLAFFLKIVLF
jgi:hypothetical protein